MKKIFLVFVIFFAAMAVSGAELFYSNGTSVSVTKAESFSVVKSDVSAAFVSKNELYRLNTGSDIYSFVSGNGGELPVYFLGNMPVVAERTVFWRGTKSVEYMENKYGMKLDEILPSYPLYAFTVQGDSVEIAEKIVKNGDGYAFPDLVKETTLRFVPEKTPKDPYFDVQWHLQNRGKTLDYQGKDVDVLKNADTKFIQMLEFLNTNEIEVNTNTKIAIMDTGIVPDHEDLTNIEPGYDAINDKEGGYPDTSVLNGSPYAQYLAASVGHGTTCAGVSAALGNETGMSGMCPWCNLYPVRYLEGTSGTASSDSTMIKVYEKYVADPDISVVNCSFGPDSSYGIIPTTPGEITSHQNFMQNGRNGLGGVIVYASGNDGTDSSYEQLLSYDFIFKRNGVDVKNRVVTVNASTAWDTRAEYSNYGFSSTVAAPSLSETTIVGIATTAIPGYGDYKKDYTLQFSGTSAAAPVVSGFFGAVFSINPSLTLEEAVDILKNSADKIYPETGLWDDKGFSVKYGYGRVNLEKAARLAAGYPMCDGEKDEVCGNNIDDNCNGYVDEGCADKLTAGDPCEKKEDCLSESITVDDVECLKASRYWVFKDGYCVRKSGKATCPDGTNPNGDYDAECLLECSDEHPCPKGFACTDKMLGKCFPECSGDTDCSKDAYCDKKTKLCHLNPSEPMGPCETAEDCKYNNGFSTMCMTEMPGGICIIMCRNDDACNDDEDGINKCAEVEFGPYGSYNICLPGCEDDSQCRNFGYGYSMICHKQYNGKTNICGMPCEEDLDCLDIDEETKCVDSRCVPLNDPEETDTDEDTEPAVEDEDTVDDSDDDMTLDDDQPAKKKSSGCSVTAL